MSYPFILLQTPYDFPATGSCIINNTGGLTFGATDPNVFANGSFTNSQGFYWNEIDSDGIDRSSYFDQFLDQDITITMDQAGVVVVYSGDTNSIGTWSTDTYSGYVFGSKVQLSPEVFTGTASLIQSATSSWTYNVPVYVSINGSMSTTTTTTTTEEPTTTSTTTEMPYLEFTLLNTNTQVYANGASGSQDPVSSRNGWYFINDTAGEKINWYFFDGTTYSITVADISAFAVVELDSTTSRPWLSVLTKPTGTGDFFPDFFKSSQIYNWPLGSTTGVKYLIYFGQDPNILPELPRVQLTPGTTQGSFLSTEEVFTVVLHSDSGASVNDVQFVVEKLGINTPSVKGIITLEIEEPTTTTSTTTSAPSENLLNCYVYYNNSTGTDKSLLTHNFYFYENWVVSSTYSGYSYSFGQKPIGLTAYDSFIINSTGSSTFSYFTISVFTYSGDIFTIYASTNQPTKGYNSVDALKIARYFTGGLTFSETQKKAADVNATGIVNSTDGLRIQQRFVKLSSTFAKGDWTLFPMTFSLSELAATSSGYILTITISCVGDIG